METETQKEIQPKQLYINGEWREASSGASFETINPATGEVLTTVACASAEDVDAAVLAARKAFEKGPWSTMSASDRGKLLWRLADRLEEKREEFAMLETLDNGKPIFETSYIDVPQAVECFRYFAGWATKIQGETIPVRGNYLNYTLHEPLGVCGLIVPWNFPLLLSVWKVAPALAAGNTIILKPSIETPLTVLKLAELFDQLEFPPGVFNVIPGRGSEVGAALVDHDGVDKIAFTGETTTGQEIMRQAARTLKRVSLELGGKSPNIVFADADLGEAAKGARIGIFYNQGEICSAGSRRGCSQGSSNA